MPVTDGLAVVCIVTLTDVVYHYSDVEREIHEQKRRTLRELERRGGGQPSSWTWPHCRHFQVPSPTVSNCDFSKVPPRLSSQSGF